jgi:hypothetical protein
MNAAPGIADPRNPVLPFGAFERLHFARLVVLDDALQVDLQVHGLQPQRLPTYLAFIGDCDGPAHDALAELAQRAGAGLARIFGHCEGFAAGADLLAWMRAHDRRAAASFVNWVGRSVRQIREESALQRLAERIRRGWKAIFPCPSFSGLWIPSTIRARTLRISFIPYVRM